ncbi:unnamed protein product [Didymodactylos carnosus]|uniref:J domain-containing protein n=1 Tax=Didymodactylos carnosus TaxID=1234261 RepID=A0A8S2HXC7_9BILA|nr:unnamed protein product [Didymodactylos carnosus]CAF3670729.1 unnamed protein product [Didymodactylos carnosus]
MICENIKVDYYEVLGVQQDVDGQEIRRKYKELALLWHPDRNKSSDAEEKFKLIKQAYEILSDEQQRKKYDDQQLRQKNVKQQQTSTYCTTSTVTTEPTCFYPDEFMQYFQSVYPVDILGDLSFFNMQTFDGISSNNESNLFSDVPFYGDIYFVPETSKNTTRTFFSRLLSNLSNFTTKNQHHHNHHKLSDKMNKMSKEKHSKSHSLFPDPIYTKRKSSSSSKTNQFSSKQHHHSKPNKIYNVRHSKSSSVYLSPSIKFFDLPLVFPENFFDDVAQLNKQNNLFKFDPYNFLETNDVHQTLSPTNHSQSIFEQQKFPTTDSFFDDLSSCTVCQKRISNRTKLLQHETVCKQNHQHSSKQTRI